MDTKERSELTMIADLVRNDLGKVARNGTVFTKARSLRHCGDLLCGTIYICTSSSEITVQQLLKAIFPAGSITGAPKRSAMKYISDLERHERKLYTGAIGWITSLQHCYFNVAIRTLQIEDTHTHLHVGCGLFMTLNPKEWDESVAKGNALSNYSLHDNTLRKMCYAVRIAIKRSNLHAILLLILSFLCKSRQALVGLH